MSVRLFMATVTIAALAAGCSALLGATAAGSRWSDEERATLATLALSSLDTLGADPSNRVSTNPLAVAFGRQLFFDTRLSSNGKVSCATCHIGGKDFQDSKPLANGVGVTARRTMPLAGTAHSPWMFWDGRMDSQWSQALGPLESAVEHGGDRTQYVQYIATYYRKDYERLFGALPNMTGLPAHAGPNGDSTARAAWQKLSAESRDAITGVYVNMGKSIAAFERTIALGETRFDRYVNVELTGKPHTSADSLSADEAAGLRLFIGKANCVNCHNGARLTDDHFHNTGVPVSALVAAVDSGRFVGARQLVQGEFNCLSKYSDAKPEQCSELRFAVTEGEELVRAYKTPSLRNVAERAPFMHAGQLQTLTDVIAHYDRAPRAPFGKSELKRLRLSEQERRQLEAFLKTLSAPAVVPGGLQP
jgi:cytochrome c peroxidase